MPITMQPLESGHILHVKFIDPWTLIDVQNMYKTEQVYRDDSKFIMHTLIDIMELHKIQPSTLTIGRRSPTFNHPRHGHIVIVGTSAFAQALLQTLVRVTRTAQIKFFSTEAEGMAYLHQLIADEAAKDSTPKSEERPAAGGSRIGL